MTKYGPRHGMRHVGNVLGTGTPDQKRAQRQAKSNDLKRGQLEDELRSRSIGETTGISTSQITAKIYERFVDLLVHPDRANALREAFMLPVGRSKKALPKESQTAALAWLCTVAYIDKFTGTFGPSTQQKTLDYLLDDTIIRALIHGMFKADDTDFRSYMATTLCSLEKINDKDLQRMRACMRFMLL